MAYNIMCRSMSEADAFSLFLDAENGGSGDPSIHTALGVFHGIRASLAHAFGGEELAGRTVLVQGTGSVGAKLTRLLLDAGAVLVAQFGERGQLHLLARAARAAGGRLGAVEPGRRLAQRARRALPGRLRRVRVPVPGRERRQHPQRL